MKNYKRIVASLGMATVMTVAVAVPALAEDTVTASVTSGALTASYADMTIPAVGYALADQTTTAETMTLSASDLTGTGDGWNVTVSTSDFVYSGDNGGTDIPASNFSFATPGTPVEADTDSQAIDATGGPNAGVGGSLEVARKVISAEVGFGQGNYTQTVDASLLIPGQSRAGTYTGTLTTTIASGPGS